MPANLRVQSSEFIDETIRISFKFNGKTYHGFKGDTLASALLANNVHLVGRSFKYHRPRGIMTAGSEEPNAIVQVNDSSDRTEPNVRATEVEIYEGLEASSQNCWPSVNFDIGGINNAISAFLPAGFYYKTFMWPASFWEKYEYFIRHSAGLGKSPTEKDPDIYDHRNIHCDVLVVGGGIQLESGTLDDSTITTDLIVTENNTNTGLNAFNFQLEQSGAISWYVVTPTITSEAVPFTDVDMETNRAFLTYVTNHNDNIRARSYEAKRYTNDVDSSVVDTDFIEVSEVLPE